MTNEVNKRIYKCTCLVCRAHTMILRALQVTFKYVCMHVKANELWIMDNCLWYQWCQRLLKPWQYLQKMKDSKKKKQM